MLRGFRTWNELLNHSFMHPGRVLLEETKICLVGNRTINLHVTSRANFCVLSQLDLWQKKKKTPQKPDLVYFSILYVFMERFVRYAPGLFSLSARTHARLYLCAPLTTASSYETAPQVRSPGVSSPCVSQKICANVAQSSSRVWDLSWQTVSKEMCCYRWTTEPGWCSQPQQSQMFQLSTQK